MMSGNNNSNGGNGNNGIMDDYFNFGSSSVPSSSTSSPSLGSIALPFDGVNNVLGSLHPHHQQSRHSGNSITGHTHNHGGHNNNGGSNGNGNGTNGDNDQLRTIPLSFNEISDESLQIPSSSSTPTSIRQSFSLTPSTASHTHIGGGNNNSNNNTPLSSISLRHSSLIIGSHHMHGNGGVDELSPHLASLSLSLTDGRGSGSASSSARRPPLHPSSHTHSSGHPTPSSFSSLLLSPGKSNSNDVSPLASSTGVTSMLISSTNASTNVIGNGNQPNKRGGHTAGAPVHFTFDTSHHNNTNNNTNNHTTNNGSSHHGNGNDASNGVIPMGTAPSPLAHATSTSFLSPSSIAAMTGTLSFGDPSGNSPASSLPLPLPSLPSMPSLSMPMVSAAMAATNNIGMHTQSSVPSPFDTSSIATAATVPVTHDTSHVRLDGSINNVASMPPFQSPSNPFTDAWPSSLLAAAAAAGIYNNNNNNNNNNVSNGGSADQLLAQLYHQQANMAMAAAAARGLLGVNSGSGDAQLANNPNHGHGHNIATDMSSHMANAAALAALNQRPFTLPSLPFTIGGASIPTIPPYHHGAHAHGHNHHNNLGATAAATTPRRYSDAQLYQVAAAHVAAHSLSSSLSSLSSHTPLSSSSLSSVNGSASSSSNNSGTTTPWSHRSAHHSANNSLEVDAVTIKPEMLAIDDDTHSHHSNINGAIDNDGMSMGKHSIGGNKPTVRSSTLSADGVIDGRDDNNEHEHDHGHDLDSYNHGRGKDNRTGGNGNSNGSGSRTKRSRSMSPTSHSSNVTNNRQSGHTNTNNSKDKDKDGATTTTGRAARPYTLPHRDDHQWTCPKGCGKVYRKSSSRSIKKHAATCTHVASSTSGHRNTNTNSNSNGSSNRNNANSNNEGDDNDEDVTTNDGDGDGEDDDDDKSHTPVPSSGGRPVARARSSSTASGGPPGHGHGHGQSGSQNNRGRKGSTTSDTGSDRIRARVKTEITTEVYDDVDDMDDDDHDDGSPTSNSKRRKKQTKRRTSSELAEHERWNCPYGCGKFYRTTSTRSIHKHSAECSRRPPPEQEADFFRNLHLHRSQTAKRADHPAPGNPRVPRRGSASAASFLSTRLSASRPGALASSTPRNGNTPGNGNGNGNSATGSGNGSMGDLGSPSSASPSPAISSVTSPPSGNGNGNGNGAHITISSISGRVQRSTSGRRCFCSSSNISHKPNEPCPNNPISGALPASASASSSLPAKSSQSVANATFPRSTSAESLARALPTAASSTAHGNNSNNSNNNGNNSDGKVSSSLPLPTSPHGQQSIAQSPTSSSSIYESAGGTGGGTGGDRGGGGQPHSGSLTINSRLPHNDSFISYSENDVAAIGGRFKPKRFQRRRRDASELEDFEKWHCPYPDCDKFYKKTSTRSINKHVEECKYRGDNPIPPNYLSTYMPDSPSDHSVASPSTSDHTTTNSSSTSNSNSTSNSSTSVLPSFPLSSVSIAQYSPSDLGLQNLSLRSSSSPLPSSSHSTNNSGNSNGNGSATTPNGNGNGMTSASPPTSANGRSNRINLFKQANQQRRTSTTMTSPMPSIDETTTTTGDRVDAATNH